MGKKYKTEFKVAISSPNSEPYLMTLVNALNKFIKDNKIADFTDCTTIFDYLTGLESTSKIIWQYLNKGTHEEENKEEFDQLTVQGIIDKLSELDGCVKK